MNILILSPRCIILCNVIVLTVLFLFFYPVVPTSFIKYIHRYKLKFITSRSDLRRMSINSSDDNQTIVFPDESPVVRLYLDIVRDTVCGLTLRTQEQSVIPSIEANKQPLNIEQRIAGEDWPSIGITMVGQKRLINIEWALRFVIANNVRGDFIECGVWRGGSSIFARAILKALDVNDRHVWVVDSFQGLPKARTANDNNE